MQPLPVQILLIEDDEVDIKAIQRSFQQARISNRITVARDGVEALSVLRRTSEEQIERPFLVLLDIDLPNMNGREFLEAVRSDPSLSSLVVFVLTSSLDEEDRVAAYKHHIAGYVSKSTAGPDFLDLTQLLGAYWKLVELPS